MGHKFRCEACELLCSKGEFGYLNIVNFSTNEPERVYLCKEHLAQMKKIAIDEQWKFLLDLQYQYSHEEEDLLSGEESEKELESSNPICAHCGAAVLGTNQYTVYGRHGLEHRHLCEKCFRIRKEKQELYKIHSFCGFCPETF